MKKSQLRHRGRRQGCAIGCSPHVRQRFPRGWEGQGSTRVRLRAARRVLGLQGTDSGCHFRSSKHYFRYTFALRRARQALDRQLKAKISFRGRRQWPQAISYPPTPSSVWGRGEKGGRASRRSVKRGFLEEKGGRWAGEQMRELRHRGVRRGMCNPLQPARSPALSEGLGGPGLDQGAPQGG